jgi:hypothetical protein
MLAVLLLSTSSHAVAEPRPTQDEVLSGFRGRLDGRHFSANVTLTITRSGYSEQREVTVWRDDEGGLRERLMASFQTPPIMRGMGLLYLESESGANDYFIYQPAYKRVRRISSTLAREDVYGVDLEYLGFGVAQFERVKVESLEGTRVEGREAFLIEERALDDGARFETRKIWIDEATFVPMRTEHWKLGRRVLVARTLAVETVDGVPTPVRTSFERPDQDERVEMTVDEIDYESPIPRAFFSTLQLTKTR